MSDHTITIPADLDISTAGRWTPAVLRKYANRLYESDGGFYGAAALFHGLADEIERQAPREPGWYHIEYEKLGDRRQSVYWWDGHGWFVGQFPGAKHADFGDDATITPVTIGRADS